MEQSIAKQKAAIQKQGGTAPSGSFFTVGWLGPTPLTPEPEEECPPLAENESAPMIAEAATEHKVDPALLRAVIQQESAFRPCAVSAKGAMGLMQIMPATAGDLGLEDPFDAKQNILAGARFLKQLLDRFNGDVRLSLAAYNAGPEKVTGDPPTMPDIAETKDYVERILKALEPKKPSQQE